MMPGVMMGMVMMSMIMMGMVMMGMVVIGVVMMGMVVAEKVHMPSIAARVIRPMRMPHANQRRVGKDRRDENTTQGLFEHGRQLAK
ncbi:MAG: hypothetical protein VX768_12020 [Planctomycetota bacterium]|nr:hypothetical protein [Planctomycetota bacterium]